MEFDFSTATTVDKLDGVPEDFRGLYKQGQDGKFALNSEDAGVKSAVAAITRLNTALKASRAEAKAAKGKTIDLAPLAEFGDAPDTILAGFNNKITELNDALKKKPGAEEMQRQLDKIKHDLAGQHSKDLTGRDARITALTGQLHTLMVTNEAKSALTEAGVIDADLALPFVQGMVKVDEKDGKFAVSVVDDAKDVRYSGATGAPMTIKELVAEMKAKDKFAPLFKSESPNGGGKPPGGTLPRGQNKDTSQLSAVDKISRGIAKGQAQRVRRAGAA
jgi:hypothetical protein